MEVEETEVQEVSSEEEPESGEPFDVSLVAKALILFGLSTLVIYLVLRYLAVTTYADSMWMATSVLQPGAFEGVIAVVVIFIFFGAIAYLIHIQFMKLALIAEDVLGAEGAELLSEEEGTGSNLNGP
ncbi:MAG: hypothetical protein KAR39_00095 [Thermoplasmata archaeon]|nr:hypothetical protein [Thermoplasmata archaeon]